MLGKMRYADLSFVRDEICVAALDAAEVRESVVRSGGSDTIGTVHEEEGNLVRVAVGEIPGAVHPPRSEHYREVVPSLAWKTIPIKLEVDDARN